MCSTNRLNFELSSQAVPALPTLTPTLLTADASVILTSRLIKMMLIVTYKIVWPRHITIKTCLV